MERRSRGPQARTMSLDTMKSLLKVLGSPEKGRCTVHVTGSKGKGSTSAFIASALAMDYSTMLYSSPHLHSYRERICADLHPIDEQDFASGIETIMSDVIDVHDSDDGPISTFGAMTALYFELCRKKKIEWQIVEVGLGGLWDATNVFEETDLVVITAISLEHTNILGNSAAEIAANKGAIIKPGSLVVVAQQNDPAVLPVIAEICSRQGARLIDVACEYRIESSHVTAQGQWFELNSKKHGRRTFKLSMLGEHQLKNASTAIAAMDALHEHKAVSVRELDFAIERVFVPGRLEILSKSPYVVLDGAHNGDSAKALVSGLQRHVTSLPTATPGNEKVIFVLGSNSDKDIKSILQALSPLASKIIACSSASEKAMPVSRIAEVAAETGIENFETTVNCETALRRALELAQNTHIVCVTGSLYLVAEARQFFLGPNPNWSLERSLDRAALKSSRATLAQP